MYNKILFVAYLTIIFVIVEDIFGVYLDNYTYLIERRYKSRAKICLKKDLPKYYLFAIIQKLSL